MAPGKPTWGWKCSPIPALLPNKYQPDWLHPTSIREGFWFDILAGNKKVRLVSSQTATMPTPHCEMKPGYEGMVLGLLKTLFRFDPTLDLDLEGVPYGVCMCMGGFVV